MNDEQALEAQKLTPEQALEAQALRVDETDRQIVRGRRSVLALAALVPALVGSPALEHLGEIERDLDLANLRAAAHRMNGPRQGPGKTKMSNKRAAEHRRRRRAQQKTSRRQNRR